MKAIIVHDGDKTKVLKNNERNISGFLYDVWIEVHSDKYPNINSIIILGDNNE